MKPDNFIYLVSIFVLTVPIIIDEWLLGRRRLRPYWRILALLAVIGLVYGLTEGFALKWTVWKFSTNSDTEVYILGSHIETYVINFLAFPMIGAATLLLIGAKHKVKRARKK